MSHLDRRPFFALAIILIAVVLLILQPWKAFDPAVPSGSGEPRNGPADPGPELPPPPPDDPAPDAGPQASRSPLADELNAPDGSIMRDLEILQDIFSHYRTVNKGNPTGTNREITMALSGRNPRRYAPMPRDHPAINNDGELIDRWGSPFHFHLESRHELEIRSAGPDREIYSDDDVVLSNKEPEPELPPPPTPVPE